jgi:hypothetical protein
MRTKDKSRQNQGNAPPRERANPRGWKRGSGSVRIRRGAFWIRYTSWDPKLRKYRRIEEKTEATSYKQARDLLNECLGALARGETPAAVSKAKLYGLYEDLRADYVNKCQNVEDIVGSWKHLEDFLGPDALVKTITHQRLQRYVEVRRRQLDLEAGKITLDVGTTKNREGRIAYLPSEALAGLREWDEKTKALERERGVIVRSVFHRRGNVSGTFRTASGTKRSPRRRSAGAGSRTTSGGRPHEPTADREYPKASSCRSLAGRLAPFSSATTSKTRRMFRKPQQRSQEMGRKWGAGLCNAHFDEVGVIACRVPRRESP